MLAPIWTYVALVVRQAHVCVPDLEAVAELRETHFLHLHPKVGLQTVHHLKNMAASVPVGSFAAHLSPVVRFYMIAWRTFLWISISSLLTGFVQREPESWGMVKNLSFFRSTVAFRDNLCMCRKRTFSSSFQELRERVMTPSKIHQRRGTGTHMLALGPAMILSIGFRSSA